MPQRATPVILQIRVNKSKEDDIAKTILESGDGLEPIRLYIVYLWGITWIIPIL